MADLPGLFARFEAGMDRLPPAPRRVLWFVLLWMFGVGCVGLAAFAIRSMIL